MMIYEIERLLLWSKVIDDDCWQKKLQRLQKEAKEFSIQLVGDSRTNHLEERGNDTIQARSNSDFDVKCATIHHSQSDRLIVLKVFMKSPDMFSYIRLKF
jgi:hypothetical protein